MTQKPLSVAVLVSAGRNPISGNPRACRGDALALMLAKALAGDSVRVFHAGHSSEPALADYLAFGAGTIEVIPAPRDSDILPALASVVATADLVLTGIRSETGEGSGVLPYVLAKTLDRPVLTNVLDATADGDKALVRQFLPKGKRRSAEIHLPAILSVHPLAPFHLNYAHALKISGEIVEAQIPRSISESVRTAPARWSISSGMRPLVRLKAEEKKSAHARLQSAIASEAKGGVVVIDGSPAEKAQIILNYLREHLLIEF